MKIMLKSMWSQFSGTEKLTISLLLCLFIFDICPIAEGSSIGLNYNKTIELLKVENEIVKGYMVWNPKCHMVEKNPMDPSIKKKFKKENFESCSKDPLLSSIKTESDGTSSLIIDEKAAKKYENLICCWTPINRVMAKKMPPSDDCDKNINIGKCNGFKNRVKLPSDLEVVMIKCEAKKNSKDKKNSVEVYKNIHYIFNPVKVQNRLKVLKGSESNSSQKRKISILILGLDSVSRSNFQRSLPHTAAYLQKNGWHDLKGYNKMADNTFPNLMAFLTGQDSQTSYNKCDPTKAFGLDKCPFIWQNFRNAGYVTAYGEDVVNVGTFNFMKFGFVEPPTDYYLRPYMIACEQLLKEKKRFDGKYCTGPELTADRIFNSASNFAKQFFGLPYFGLFWTNTVSHDDSNAPSSMDDHFLKMFENFEKEGITNDTVMVFLSDHGTRYGEIRESTTGWHEERLPFIYMKFPSWMKEKEEISQALRINERRLTSPFDLYETFRDILIKSGGNANPSIGCPTCQSLMKPVPFVRGCKDAGISPHWCTCSDLKPASTSDKIAKEGSQKFLQFMENAVKDYKDAKGSRLCAKLKVRNIFWGNKIIDLDHRSKNENSIREYSYFLEVQPGGGKFEYTLKVNGDGNYTISPDEISRTNSYFHSAKCLTKGPKMFCHCGKK